MIALAVLASIGWGASDFFGGLSRRDVLVFSVLTVSQLLGAAMIVPAIALTGPPRVSGHLLLACVAGLGVTLELGVVYYAVSIGAAFIGAPVGALGTALAVTTGLLGGDLLTRGIALGLVCTVLGGGLSAAGDGDFHAPVRRGRSIAACLLASVGVAVMQITLHAAGKVNPYWAAEFEHLTTAGFAALLACMITLRARARPSSKEGNNWRPRRDQLPMLALVAAMGAGGDVAYAAAATGALSTVSAIASLYPLSTITLAYAIQHRRPHRLQTAGVVLALAGATILGAVST